MKTSEDNFRKSFSLALSYYGRLEGDKKDEVRKEITLLLNEKVYRVLNAMDMMPIEFNIPDFGKNNEISRTSAWELVRRMERAGLVTVSKSGNKQGQPNVFNITEKGVSCVNTRGND